MSVLARARDMLRADERCEVLSDEVTRLHAELAHWRSVADANAAAAARHDEAVATALGERRLRHAAQRALAECLVDSRNQWASGAQQRKREEWTRIAMEESPPIYEPR